MPVRVNGLEAGRGEPVFAFMVLRLAAPLDRAALVELIHHVAPLVSDVERLVADVPDDPGVAMRLVGIPWSPPAPGDALAAQRRRIEEAESLGLEQAWFFQTGTRLSDASGDEARPRWTHGPPPQATQVRFPVDGYPEILEARGGDDLGIAIKLAGPWAPGETTVLVGFHAMWLAPYRGRYRDATVTIDQRRHAAHLWVERFAAAGAPREHIQHLLWIVSKLDEVIPVLHARFRGAARASERGRAGDDREPFVLGGNPLIAAHRTGGARGVDAWIASQTAWSSEEVAHMLRELAEELVVRGEPAQAGEVHPRATTGDRLAGPRGRRGEDELRERTRDLTSYAGELLATRARIGALDPRAAGQLRPLLAAADRHEHRRIAAVSILGALRDRDSAPAMIRILEVTRIASALDRVGKAELLAATAAALGAIGDPAAVPALSRLVAAPGHHNDEPRAAAASALAACAAAAPAAPRLDDAIFEAMTRAIARADDDEVRAEIHLAYGALASTLPPERRRAARQRLLDLAQALDPAGVAMLARRAALMTCDEVPPDEGAIATLRARLHATLRDPGYDHDAAIRNLRIVLRLAARLRGLVDAADLVWLTRLAEPDIRARAHELLEAAGLPMPAAAAFDRRTARALSDDELVRWIGEPHVVGRAALVVEAGRRRLAAARPAIIAATHAAIDRARPAGQDLLAPDARLLETAVAALLDGPLDSATIALFDRMLRHANPRVKWELLQAPPRDERLIDGMIHVLGEDWGWQEVAARRWLASTAVARIARGEHAGDSDDDDTGDDSDDDDTGDDSDDQGASNGDDDGRVN